MAGARAAVATAQASAGPDPLEVVLHAEGDEAGARGRLADAEREAEELGVHPKSPPGLALADARRRLDEPADA